MQNGVQHVPEKGCFVVQGHGDMKYLVSLFPKAKCSCASRSGCYHISAVQKSIGMPSTQQKRPMQLSVLKKNSRKRSDKKSGTKKPRPMDYDYEPAADSTGILSECEDDNSSGKAGENSSSVTSSKNITTESSSNNLKNSNIDEKEADATPVKKQKPQYSCDGTPKSILKNTIVPSKRSSKRHVTFKAEKISGKNSCRKLRLDTEPESIIINSSQNEADIESKSMRWAENKDILLSDIQDVKKHGEMINDRIMSYVNKLLKLQFSNTNGFQDTLLIPHFKNKWTYRLQFEAKAAPCGQIHYNGSAHWLCSYNLTTVKNGKVEVFLLDSLMQSRKLVSDSVCLQLAKIYGSECSELNLTLPQLQQRSPGSNNCGPFAVAHIVEFCLNSYSDFKSDINWQFDETQLRSHLVQCLAHKKLTAFPKITVPNYRPSLHKIKVPLFCTCKLPEVFDNLIECIRSRCKAKFHKTCKNIDVVVDSWNCECCKDKRGTKKKEVFDM